MKEGLKLFRAEANKIAEIHGIPNRLAMKAVSIAKKRSCIVDGAIIQEAKGMMEAKVNAKKELREKELAHGKVLRLYSEHLLETLVKQNDRIITLLEKNNA